MAEQIRIHGIEVALHRKKHNRFCRQKILAHQVGISERSLRKIEKGNTLQDKVLAERLATALDTTLDGIVFSAAGPKLVPPSPPPAPVPVDTRFQGKQLYPRFDQEYADLVKSADNLLVSAQRAEIIITEYHTPLNGELTGYADELVALSREASRETRGWLDPVDEVRADEICKRMRHLLVQLKGNDVLVYVYDHTKYLPESDEVLPNGRCGDFQFQVIIAFGAPQEWGETNVKVDVDHGQPYIIDWDKPLFANNPA